MKRVDRWMNVKWMFVGIGGVPFIDKFAFVATPHRNKYNGPFALSGGSGVSKMNLVQRCT